MNVIKKYKRAICMIALVMFANGCTYLSVSAVYGKPLYPAQVIPTMVTFMAMASWYFIRENEN